MPITIRQALPPHLRPYLMSITREDALVSEGSQMSRSFVYTPPRIFFDRREQEVLRLALGGAPDDEIANTLGVGQSAVFKRWLRIYDRVSHALPTLLPANEGESAARKSGGSCCAICRIIWKNCALRSKAAITREDRKGKTGEHIVKEDEGQTGNVAKAFCHW